MHKPLDIPLGRSLNKRCNLAGHRLFFGLPFSPTLLRPPKIFCIIHHLPLLINGYVERGIVKATRTLDLSEQPVDLAIAGWPGKVKPSRVYPTLSGAENATNVGRIIVLGG